MSALAAPRAPGLEKQNMQGKRIGIRDRHLRAFIDRK